MPLRDLVVIENATIDSMAADSRYVAAVPCLARFRQTAKPGCGRCAKRASQRATTTSYNDAKQCLTALDSESKQKLGQLLNARQIRIQLMQSNGSGVQYTIKLQS